MNEYNSLEEIKKLCNENKINFIGGETPENLYKVGLGSLLHKSLSEFLDSEPLNQFKILNIRNPNSEENYTIKIQYCGGENPSDVKKSGFVLDPKELPQQIDHAVGKIKMENKKLRYYGVFLIEEREEDTKSGTVTIKQKVPALVLENGEIISQRNSQGAEFEFSSIMSLKNNRWSLNSIRDFVKGITPDYTFKEVFETFKQFYTESLVFDQPEWYETRPLRDMKSYFWDLNDKFLIPKVEGKTGTAKSKTMKVGANLSFNGKKFLCPTPANFFRYRHNNKSTLYIEEAERLFSDGKKNSEDSQLVEYLNGSYEKGNFVPRQNEKNLNQTDEFDPAGDTEIGAIASLKGALEKRGVTQHMIKAPANDPRGNVEIPSETDPEYQKARDKMYICGLKNYKEYEKALQNVENKFGLKNREWALAKPYIALANCIDLELGNRIGNFLAKQFTLRDDSVEPDSWEAILSKILVEVYSIHEGEFFISVDELKNIFSEQIGDEYSKISNIRVGMLIKKMGFENFKCNPTGTQRGYRMTFWKVCEILLRQEWLNIETIKQIIRNKSSELLGCKYTEDKISKWYTDNLLTTDNLNNETTDNLTTKSTFSVVEQEKKSEIFNEEDFND